jgi:hypothetical protein
MAAGGAAGAPPTPFLLTEFNCGLGMDCADSVFSASFIAGHALSSQAIADKVTAL